ncbi:helix-turn-helix domain-containing protein [Pseudomonas tremae]|uniref:helix-turn-helix domain-containing protein n=1 Tax=Pseudomonas syringae group TaxID=136849 RepID=UPI00068614C6|nr:MULTISPECIES: helix-turn-helix transcriptional regulator [Pseudomonas syringae group]MCQ3018887.1 helix-turn-helix domain-containing protein [Pseudomonas tremae]QGL57425.1 Fis family transcriptional regulator [Pseudomonas coronafaciens pv. oryzae str. 1_6]RMM31851.1 DNA-binding protein [Pseudomonas coronafaciens pv. oryzae]
MMPLNQAFAAAMKFVRAHHKLLQQDVSTGLSQARISQLESGKNSATLETTRQVAQAMRMNTTSFVATVLAVHDKITPREVLNEAIRELESLGLLDVDISQYSPKSDHPVSQKSANTRAEVQKLKAAGHRHVDVVRMLGLGKLTVTRYWREE